MIKLIKKVQVYAPENLGVKDILIAGEKIVAIENEIDGTKIPNCEIINADNLIAVPGFIDGHVHMIGGGGEGGPKTRTPELNLTKALEAGVTTVVGCLGTDGTTRQMSSLLAKAQALEAEGISTYIYTGSYEVPVPTLTGSVKTDLLFVDKVIGVGEVAISDHRSSQPTYNEIKQLAAQTRVGGMLSGKAGLVHLHVGSEKEGIDYIFNIVEETDIPIKQFLPTHMGRTEHLLNQGLELINMGGRIDITASEKAIGQVKYLLDQGADIEGITVSSDGNGSLPKFDSKGNLIGLKVGEMKTVFNLWKALITKHNIPIEQALKITTSNVANNLKINHKKGSLKIGLDADILILDYDLNMEMLISRGSTVVKGGKPIIFGTFER
ncbi:MAG: beta-aspartyl-peptidase [Clostridia bacterium]